MRHKDIDLGKGYDPWGDHRKVKPPDTHRMLPDEIRMLELVAEHGPIESWRLFRYMAGGYSPDASANTEKLGVLSTRLIREGKLARLRTQHSMAGHGLRGDPGIRNLLILGPSYVPPAYKDVDAHLQKDLGGAVCHVSGSGGLDEERRSLSKGRRGGTRQARPRARNRV